MQILALRDTTGGTTLDTLEAAAGRWVWISSGELQRARDSGKTGFTLGNIMPHPLEADAHAVFAGGRVVRGWSATPR